MITAEQDRLQATPDSADDALDALAALQTPEFDPQPAAPQEPPAPPLDADQAAGSASLLKAAGELSFAGASDRSPAGMLARAQALAAARDKEQELLRQRSLQLELAEARRKEQCRKVLEEAREFQKKRLERFK